MKVHLDLKDDTLTLSSAILMYSDNASRIVYASMHAVDFEDGVPSIKAGTAIQGSALSEALVSLTGNSNLHFFPEEVLAYNGQNMVFWLPPKARAVSFDAAEPMGKRTGITPHPGLVFIASFVSSPKVFAVQGSERPGKTTKIFHAPYMNTSEDGSLCMGNVKYPAVSPDQMEAWEAAFFSSYFTHPNSSRNVQYPGGMYALWYDLLEGEHSGFPDCLTPYTSHGDDVTLQDLITDMGAP